MFLQLFLVLITGIFSSMTTRWRPSSVRVEKSGRCVVGLGGDLPPRCPQRGKVKYAYTFRDGECLCRLPLVSQTKVIIGIISVNFFLCFFSFQAAIFFFFSSIEPKLPMLMVRSRFL